MFDGRVQLESFGRIEEDKFVLLTVQRRSEYLLTSDLQAPKLHGNQREVRSVVEELDSAPQRRGDCVYGDDEAKLAVVERIGDLRSPALGRPVIHQPRHLLDDVP